MHGRPHPVLWWELGISVVGKGHKHIFLSQSLFFLFCSVSLWQAVGNKDEVSENRGNGIRDTLENRACSNFCVKGPQREWKWVTTYVAKVLLGNEWLDSPGNPFVPLIHSLTMHGVPVAGWALCCCWGYTKSKTEQVFLLWAFLCLPPCHLPGKSY